MKLIAFSLLLITIFGFSCGSVLPAVFKKGTLHEQYADKLRHANLHEGQAGVKWLSAASESVKSSRSIKLPYKNSASLKSDSMMAVGLKFEATRGQRLSVELREDTSDNFVLYADVFRVDNDSIFTPVFSADTASVNFDIDVEETGTYVLRLQRELERKGDYKLSVKSGPSLGFPVTGKANVGSFWGDNREGGKRSHEGIDIFAKKGTPVVAAADGHVTGVKEGGIGGKTIWMRVPEKNIYLYYAHLDQQLVQEGQEVSVGDTLGLVGNTGNAKYTPPHLHFGVYTYNGAIDPLPFVGK